jgi:spore coat protein CotH
MSKLSLYKLSLCLSIIFVLSCSSDIDQSDGTVDRSSLKDWNDLTHGKLEKPAYDIAFKQGSINTLEIYLSKENWDSIKIDMKNRSGISFGGGGIFNPGGGGGGPLDLVPGDPRWVECKVVYNSKLWEHVGFRLKGNSSLSSAWRTGNFKIPFKLSFDEYEDKYKAVTNQRFFGFKEFSASPAFSDKSFIKEKIVADIFRENGIPAARTAFYKIYIDFGEGLKYCGVYTMVEVIDDSMVKDQFNEEKGNIYKPESNFQSFIQAQFEKKNNTSQANYGDVQAVISALNSTSRTTDPKAWREGLEKVFDVDHFLKYLAINNTIVNWDVYGAIAHNYYLYTPTYNNKVTWIPWDFNLAMTQQTDDAKGGFGRGLSFGMQEVTSRWPLIRYLIDDPNYFDKYKSYVKKFIQDYYNPQNINPIIETHANVIGAAVMQEIKPYSYLNNTNEFTSAISTLKTHTENRYRLASEFTK